MWKNQAGFQCIVVQRTQINLVLCKRKSSTLGWPSLWGIWEEERKMETWLILCLSWKGPGFLAHCWQGREVWHRSCGQILPDWGLRTCGSFKKQDKAGESPSKASPQLGCYFPSSLNFVPGYSPSQLCAAPFTIETRLLTQFCVHQNLLEVLLKHGLLGPVLRVSESGGLGAGPGNLHFSQVPRWSCYFWSGGHALGTLEIRGWVSTICQPFEMKRWMRQDPSFEWLAWQIIQILLGSVAPSVKRE